MNNNSARTLELERRLAAWSDRIQPQAADLAGGYRDLLARRITNAQLSGLNNVVQAAPSFRQIKLFIERQGDKAMKAGREDVADYWNAVGKALESLRRDAEQMLTSVPGGPQLNTPAGKLVLDGWHCRLVQEYVQHLVAHSIWARPAPNRRSPERDRT